MKTTIKSSIRKTVSLLAAAIAAMSCITQWEDSTRFGNMPDGKPDAGRVPTQETRKVLLLYSAGYNSLRPYLIQNMEDLKKGWLPGNRRNEDVLLVYSHLPVSTGNYNVPSSPVLMQIYCDGSGQVVTDTLVTYPENTISSSAQTLCEVLSFVHDTFPAKGYGLLFSSHATGYLPAGFYSNPNGYVYHERQRGQCQGQQAQWQYGSAEPVPYIDIFRDPSLPAVKSIGQDRVRNLSYEMEIKDFAEAIPMYLDYIMFDACLMGGIEVAYELKDKCGQIGFSQAEVLAEGFDYTALATHLLKSRIPDPQKVCEDYFTRYDMQSGLNRSATISLVDCSKLEPLAVICRRLFSKYRTGLDGALPSNVQRFYRYSYHWFYDLYSIVAEAGANAEELEELQHAMDRCVKYKAATPSFITNSHNDGGFVINVHSGLTMYLPSDGNVQLDRYYRQLKWNKDTGLVE